jgi:hypothetical protein
MGTATGMAAGDAGVPASAILFLAKLIDCIRATGRFDSIFRGFRRHFVAALVLAPALAGACDMVAVPVVHGRAVARGVTVALGAADDAAHPTAWQGPVTISAGFAPACVVNDEVSIVEAPILLGRGILYLPTYSGSNNRVYAVDSRSCRVLWRSRDFDGATSFRGGKLTMGKKSVRLDDDCRPVRGAVMKR